MTDATQSRDEALELFEIHRAEWLANARSVAAQLYRRTGRPITVDDIRDKCPPPPGWDPRVMGGVFAAGWTPVGYTRSLRRACHRRPIRTFKPTEQST